MLYDLLLIIAIWTTTTAAVISFNNGDAVEGWQFQLLLYGEILLFYFIFWRIKGQSLGMQVWKIKTVDDADQIISTRQALYRLFLASICIAPAGAGFFWMLFNKQRLTLYDQLSNTRVIYLGSKPYASEMQK